MSGLVYIFPGDHQDTEALGAVLEAEFFEVILSSDPRKIRTDLPDVILLHAHEDTYDICSQVKSDPVSTHLPIVILSHHFSPEERIKALKKGADDTLTLPVKPVLLLARVRSLIRLKRVADEWRFRQGMMDSLENMPRTSTDDPRAWKLARFLVLDVSDAVFSMITKLYDGELHHLDRHDSAQTDVRSLMNTYYDCILIEMKSKDAQKLKFCTMIRSSEKLRHVPILIVAPSSDEELMLQALELGANDIISLPTNEDELLMRTRTQILRRRYQMALEDSYKKSLEMALTDPLTGLYNRRYAEKHMEGLMGAGAGRHERDVSILMLDIDHFKSFNDTYGHASGDTVLREVARRLQRSLRNFDLVARVGGEEFMCLLPDAKLEIAQKAGERIRKVIADEPVFLPDPMISVNVTISVGVASHKVQETTPEVLMKKADDALYKAKKSGRNRVETAA